MNTDPYDWPTHFSEEDKRSMTRFLLLREEGLTCLACVAAELITAQEREQQVCNECMHDMEERFP